MGSSEQYTGLNRILQSDAVQTIIDHVDDGTFAEFVDDWRWIFSFSWRYRAIIALYTLVGMLGSSLSLGSAYVGRILIYIVVGNERDKLGLLIGLMLGMTALNLVLGAVSSRIFTKISIYVNNDIQAHIFDHIIDARWKELSQYQSGDLLNRFKNGVGTIASNAIGWIPNLVINIYTFVATFVVLFQMDSIMAWIAILSAPFLLVMSRHIMRRQKEYRRRVLQLNSGMMSFEVIKSFGIFGYYGNKLREWQAGSGLARQYAVLHLRPICVVPFLSLVAGRVDSIDLRHFDGSLQTYIETERPDAVVVMYNPGALASDNAALFDFR